MGESRLTHLDQDGAARMVDVGDKQTTVRTATASALCTMQLATAKLIQQGDANKGDVLQVARIAGIGAAKKTSDLIPLCHNIPLTSVQVTFRWLREDCLRVEASAKTVGQTGVEMEALMAASVAALTVYDMCKAVDREMRIQAVQLEQKSGGASGEFVRKADKGE